MRSVCDENEGRLPERILLQNIVANWESVFVVLRIRLIRLKSSFTVSEWSSAKTLSGEVILSVSILFLSPRLETTTMSKSLFHGFR